MTKRTALLGVSILACGCAARGPADAHETAAALLERCSGRFECTADDGETFGATLEEEDGVCYSGNLELGADGSVESPDDPGWPAGDVHWTGDAVTFRMCSDASGLCVTCVDPNGGVAPPAHAPEEEESVGRCVGSPPSCHSQSYGYCAYVDGCYGASHLRWDGSWDNVCEGSARRCDGYSWERACEDQPGCSWSE